MEPFSFTCWHCNVSQIATEQNTHQQLHTMHVGSHSRGQSALFVSAVRCLKDECNQLNLRILHGDWNYTGNTARFDYDKIYNQWRLLPESTAVSQPECVPAPLAKDYYEACRIVDLSPKASATLARRCLQGMIRDFCGITKSTLAKEIEALVEQLNAGNAPKGVSDESVEALNAIRTIGNIGAHMEKDINVIVEVDPDEARTLLDVVEQLFVDWYVQREERQKRFATAKAIASAKQAQKSSS